MKGLTEQLKKWMEKNNEQLSDKPKRHSDASKQDSPPKTETSQVDNN